MATHFVGAVIRCLMSAMLVVFAGCGGGLDGSNESRPVPTHGGTFLSLRDGGSNAEAYYLAIGAIDANGQRDTFDAFKQRNNLVPTNIDVARAVYFNAGDLNIGRDMNCVRTGAQVACYVSNHGPKPDGPQVFPNVEAALASATGTGPLDLFATVAMEYGPLPAEPPITKAVRECDGQTALADGTCQEPVPPGVGSIGTPAPRIDVDSGIDLSEGDVVTVTATGTIFSGQFAAPRNDAGGLGNATNEAKFPLPSAPPFSLIAHVDSQQAFLVGPSLVFTHNGAPGRLFFRTNDDTPGNGDGRFTVTVTVQRPPGVKFYVYGQNGSLLNKAALDSEGPKEIPGLCLACHGGKYDKTLNIVRGAAFLPFNLLSFKYSTLPDFTRAAQEERFRRLNELVKQTRTPPTGRTDAIIDFIDGGYSPLKVETAGAVMRDDYVPVGWNGNQGPYLNVIRPFCTSCHLALEQDRRRDFLRFTDVASDAGLKALVQVLVCDLKTMPHSEVAYNAFWTDTPGGVSWSGYFEATVGLTNCARPAQ